MSTKIYVGKNKAAAEADVIKALKNCGFKVMAVYEKGALCLKVRKCRG